MSGVESEECVGSDEPAVRRLRDGHRGLHQDRHRGCLEPVAVASVVEDVEHVAEAGKD